MVAWLPHPPGIGTGSPAPRHLERRGVSDRGVILYRSILSAAIDAVERGEDPPGLVRDHDAQYGAGTLKKMLLGEAFGMRDGQRYELSAYARNSEHFGVLRGTFTRERIQEYFDRLRLAGENGQRVAPASTLAVQDR